MSDEKRAPVQGYSAGIPWLLHLRVWDAYAAKYGRDQSPERIAERGGFGVYELDTFVPSWREEVDEIARMRERIAALEAERDALATEAEWDNLVEQDARHCEQMMCVQGWINANIHAGEYAESLDEYEAGALRRQCAKEVRAALAKRRDG